MISYARLGAKVWNVVIGWRGRRKEITAERCTYLDFQVEQWIQSIPSQLKFDLDGISPLDPYVGDNVMMQQVLLALQANQLRILLYRQNLLSTASINTEVSGAYTAVKAAKRTVQVLDHFNRVSDIYRRRPEPFNHFLISALAAMLLAVLHAPSRFSHLCRQDFYVALDIIRKSSAQSRTSRRLKNIIARLKLIGLNLASSHHSNNNGPSQKDENTNHAATDTTLTNLSSTDICHDSNHSNQIPIPDSSNGTSQESPRLTGYSGIPLALSDVQSGPGLPLDTGLNWDENNCQYLTNFFETTAGVFIEHGMSSPEREVDDRVDTDTNQRWTTDALGELQANEALTQVMSELL